MKHKDQITSKGYNIVIQQVNKNGGIIRTSTTLFSKDWKQDAERDFKEFEPGKNKVIKVYEGDKIIYHYKNF